MRIASMLSEDAVRLSCEVFPPKKFKGLHQAEEAVKKIAALHPAFMSVTYARQAALPTTPCIWQALYRHAVLNPFVT